MEKKKIKIGDLQKKATERLESIMGGGNVRETASYVLSVAEVLNDQSPSTAKGEDEMRAQLTVNSRNRAFLLFKHVMGLQTTISTEYNHLIFIINFAWFIFYLPLFIR